MNLPRNDCKGCSDFVVAVFAPVGSFDTSYLAWLAISLFLYLHTDFAPRPSISLSEPSMGEPPLATFPVSVDVVGYQTLAAAPPPGAAPPAPAAAAVPPPILVPAAGPPMAAPPPPNVLTPFGKTAHGWPSGLVDIIQN